MTYSNNKKFWLKTGLFAGFVFFLVAFGEIFVPIDTQSSKEIIFSIEKGQGSRDIAHNLQRQELILSVPFFRLYVLTAGVSHKLQAGDYLVSPSLSPFDMVQKFTTGDVIEEKITIIEGWNIEDIASYLSKRGLAEKDKVLGYKSLEGYLFPDTYEVKRGEGLELIIQKMRKNFEAKLNPQLREEILRQGKTIHEVITMASLLERELKTLADKKIAADVLRKRLSIGMALQVDAAPITYAVPGLPQNPIANPGLESIQATLYPTESPYWYYLSTPEGPPGGEASKTIFSKTLEEHNIAKAKYLKN